MIWIVGEYAERIDNADELLESFLEGFHDESTQVQLQLLTAIVKLFLKKPTETQELVQQVLSLATQDSDNPDLRDRGYIYWRLLSTDPVAAKEVVLAEKPLISEETDLIEPTLLEELICHIGTLASVYHKPPSAFVEGSRGVQHKRLHARAGSGESAENSDVGQTGPSEAPPAVIPSQGDLLGDLLNLDLAPPTTTIPSVQPSMQMGAMDLLGGGLDSLMGDESDTLGGDLGGSPSMGAGLGVAPAAMPATLGGAPAVGGGLGDLFDLGGGVGMPSGSYVAPKTVWLPAMKAKGLEISGTFARRSGVIQMDLSLTNKAMSVMIDFAIQFNKNSFGLSPAGPLQILTPLSPNQTIDVSLPLSTVGPIMKMEPLNNLQVAVKNNIDVFYFSCQYPLSLLFVEDGKMDRQVFLATWKDIPSENESQFQISSNANLNSDAASNKLQGINIFTIAKRTVEGQDMLYQSVKLTNGIWVLAELRMQTVNPNYTLSVKCRAPEVSQFVYQCYELVLRN
ncbi:putative AP-1 complex subunit beta-1 [Triplophysa rosa]|uniref:AP-1 complex subunit beta-1 n=2 Tax=Triplophysa rosa TaxID=992332 RepID=A0A9W8CBT5_TRIRA|nr:putative AP-1 complex subunit beta-1 [Triplophysa rosa]